VYGLSRVMTMSDVAELTLLSWDTVKAITKTHLAKDYGKPPLQGVRYLGIDEIYLGSKKRYYTIVIDLEDGRILWAKPGRGGAALQGFWPRLRRAKAKIKAVATDMSAAYWSAVLDHLPDAALVFDKLDIRGFSWLTQTKKWEGFEEKRRAFRMEMVGRPSAFFV
jgi:transposase